MKLHVIIFALFASLAFAANGAAHQPILITYTKDADTSEPNKHTWEIKNHKQHFTIGGDTVEWRNNTNQTFRIVVLQTKNVTWSQSDSTHRLYDYTTCPFDKPLPSGCSYKAMEAWQEGADWVVRMNVKGTSTTERPLYFVLLSVDTGLVLLQSSRPGKLTFPYDYYAMTDAMLSW